MGIMVYHNIKCPNCGLYFPVEEKMVVPEEFVEKFLKKKVEKKKK